MEQQTMKKAIKHSSIFALLDYSTITLELLAIWRSLAIPAYPNFVQIINAHFWKSQSFKNVFESVTSA